MFLCLFHVLLNLTITEAKSSENLTFIYHTLIIEEINFI